MKDETFDFWVCDECRCVYKPEVEQMKVRIQQRTERIYGTEVLTRPIETMTICPRCHNKYVVGVAR